MDLTVPQAALQAALTELAAAYFQAAVSLALVVLCVQLHRRYRKAYFRDWAVAWGVYTVRMGAIIAFLHTGYPVYLFYHQVLTGWTALALLWAALVFAQQLRWQPRYALLLIFPPVWSYLAIYELDNFLAAALPAVLFLHVATLATAWAFFQYWREAGSRAARLLAVFLALWALHHLDYPFLRARGIWNPWGYYLDVLFQLSLGAGLLLLVQEDLDQGLKALSALSAELQAGHATSEVSRTVIERALELRAVRGSALYWVIPTNGTSPPASGIPGVILAAGGEVAAWEGRPPDPAVEPLLTRMLLTSEPQVATDLRSPDFPHDYVAALPLIQGQRVAGALVVVGQARDPFTALDDSFLVTLGQQMGGALWNADLNRRLADRTRELERLQDGMIQRHEAERNRISRELHDETAQVLAAVNLRLGLLQEKVAPEDAQGLEETRRLLGDGIRSIRQVARNLRPVALDDLGVLSALRALVRDLSAEGRLEVDAHLPPAIPPLSPTGELVLYRTVQEALANVVRHSDARRVTLTAREEGTTVVVTVEDDGGGYPAHVLEGTLRPSSGLAGIRERIAAAGGEVTLGRSSLGGARLEVRLDVSEAE